MKNKLITFTFRMTQKENEAFGKLAQKLSLKLGVKVCKKDLLRYLITNNSI